MKHKGGWKTAGRQYLVHAGLDAHLGGEVRLNQADQRRRGCVVGSSEAATIAYVPV